MELIDRKRVAFSCASLGAAGIYFQACSFTARTSVPVNASGPQRLGERYGRGPTQKRELGTERSDSGDRGTGDLQQPAVRLMK
jgi:hypothetical protein